MLKNKMVIWDSIDVVTSVIQTVCLCTKIWCILKTQLYKPETNMSSPCQCPVSWLPFGWLQIGVKQYRL